MFKQNNSKTEKRARTLVRCLFVLLALSLLFAGLSQIYKFYCGRDLVQFIRGQNTVESIVAQYGEQAHKRLHEKFSTGSVIYPPAWLTMLGLKTEKALEIYSTDRLGKEHYVCTYPILGTSGVSGPKLREGDKQMPEGFYRIREFEPNSSYHVALRVDYPSAFDREKGKLDLREHLGCDIMIHGKDCSVGCLAMGDEAAEDLFVLVHDVGLENTELIMSPFDFRHPPEKAVLPETPAWIADVYTRLKDKILSLPARS